MSDFASARQVLVDARRQGAPFPVAWSRALERLSTIEGSTAEARTAEARERRHTREALLSTRHAWQAAYEGRPSPLDAWMVNG